ncbi:MAG TPA: M48 family metallopeptidase [Terriglobales bacterium]|nr:M48 family metallopeptidase [Terriglobales bacterium]
MKSRAIALLAFALLLVSSVAAQDTTGATNTNKDSNTKKTDTQAATTPAQSPASTTADPAKPGDSKLQASNAAAKPAESETMGADPSKVKHDGSLDDVDAIGNRKIGEKGLGDWYGIESEIKMGKQFAQQIEASVKLVNDPVISEYVNRLGQNLVRNSDAKMPVTFKVIDDDSINAITLPGGFIYVNSGTILAADNEAELAGVMAHELGHSCARHTTHQMTKMNWANIASIPLIFVGGGIGLAAREAAGIGLPVTFMKFSRADEAQADYLGAQYAWKSGYDPEALVTFFEKVEAQEKKKPGTISKAFASHPQTPDRVEATQKEIATIIPAKDQYIESTSEFDDVKARLAAIENKRKINDDKDGNKPTLRRAQNDKKGDGTSKSDDDRPTLHRRDQ